MTPIKPTPCPMFNTPCRHVSIEHTSRPYTELQRDPLTKLFKPLRAGKSVVVLGEYCNDAGKWVRDMHYCPVMYSLANPIKVIKKAKVKTMTLGTLEDLAITILKKYEPPEGYWVTFSGGKDSIVSYDLVKRSGVKHEVHFNQTTIDPPEVYVFIRENYPEVIWEKPKRSMFMAIKARQVPPTRMRRYCCAELKELHGIGRVLVTGVRKEESQARASRTEYDTSRHNSDTIYCNPIVNWKEQDVWDYIMKYHLKYPVLYDEGYTRIGCIMCPLQNRHGMLKDAVRYPKHYRAYIESFKVMLKNCEERSKSKKTTLLWECAEDVMFWWIYRIHRKNCTKSHWKLPTEDGFDLEAIKPRPRKKANI